MLLHVLPIISLIYWKPFSRSLSFPGHHPIWLSIWCLGLVELDSSSYNLFILGSGGGGGGLLRLFLQTSYPHSTLLGWWPRRCIQSFLLIPLPRQPREPNLFRACQTWASIALIFLWKCSYAIGENTVIGARSWVKVTDEPFAPATSKRTYMHTRVWRRNNAHTAVWSKRDNKIR